MQRRSYPKVSKKGQSEKSKVAASGLRDELCPDHTWWNTSLCNQPQARAHESGYQPFADMSKWIIEKQGPFTLNDNEQKIVTLPVQAVGAEEGITYIFDVTVSCDLNTDLCNPYGYKQKIYIDIID